MLHLQYLYSLKFGLAIETGTIIGQLKHTKLLVPVSQMLKLDSACLQSLCLNYKETDTY